MGNELIVPEILLLNKLEEYDNSLAPSVWKDMREVVVANEEDECKISPNAKIKRKMFFSDFVNKAISLPMEISPLVSDECYKQIYRLYLFSCQQAIHDPSVRYNPFTLGFRALEEVKLALVAIMVSYRLVTPSASYRWDRSFFENNIFVDKGADGHAIIRIARVPVEDIEKAIYENIVSDWLIYRAFDNNGIKTLMDVRNNLVTLPDYVRGGPKAAEFSRFQRKMAEKRGEREQRKEEALDLAFRKTLVESVAQKTADRFLASGMSPQDILAKAFSEDISKLMAVSEEGTDNKREDIVYQKINNRALLSCSKGEDIADESLSCEKNDSKMLLAYDKLEEEFDDVVIKKDNIPYEKTNDKMSLACRKRMLRHEVENDVDDIISGFLDSDE